MDESAKMTLLLEVLRNWCQTARHELANDKLQSAPDLHETLERCFDELENELSGFALQIGSI